MAYVIEKAGGLAISSGTKSILEIEPKDIHERCPVFLGSKEDVEECQKMMKKWDFYVN